MPEKGGRTRGGVVERSARDSNGKGERRKEEKKKPFSIEIP